MKELLQASKDERGQYFREAAARSKIISNRLIIEKDFWVCWTLDRIFSNDKLSNHVIFKGGTSLSKCYGMIDRFSEDIDLTLSKEYIGINSDNDPANATSRSQRDNRLQQLTTQFEEKIYNEIKPMLLEYFKKHLSEYFSDTEWKLEPEKDDKGNLSLFFYYPATIENSGEDYIESAVKLEFGARGDINPCEKKMICPYVQELLPALFESPPEITVTALTAKRTFWEKVTLLHAEYHRDPSKPINTRMFRHYYDVVMLDKHNLTKDALQDDGLLKDVVRNKSTYFPSNKAKYDEAVIGSLRLYPNDAFIDQLRQDHAKMSIMFFGEAPDFDETIQKIKTIESVINKR